MPDHDPLRYGFACTGCGRCCRGPGEVSLTDQDVARLARWFEWEEASWIEHYATLGFRRAGLALLDGVDGACIFLENDHCAVYEARPEQCRRFPFRHTTPAECPGLTRIART